MTVTVITIVAGEVREVFKEELEIRGRIETIQTAALQKSPGNLRTPAVA